MATEAFTGTNIESERLLIACLILDPALVAPRIASTCSGRDFTDVALGQMFDACLVLHGSGRPIGNLHLLIADLKAMSVNVTDSEVLKVARLVPAIPNASDAVFHAELIRELSRKRAIRETAARMIEKIERDANKCDDVLGWLDGQLQQLRQGGGSKARRIADVWDELIGDLQARVGKPEAAALLSGLPAADDLGLVFVGGELTVLAARPGVGKTAMATQIGMHHASRDRAVLMVSMEMRDKEVGSRVLIPAAGYNHQVLRTGRPDQGCIDDLRAAAIDLGDVPFFVWSPGRVKVGVIQAAATVLKASHGLRLLLVDYLGLILPDDPHRKRHEQIGEIVKALRGIGQQLEIPVLALCQLNREADKQRPTLSNLRESGDIEQDADIVAFLHREKNDSDDVLLIMEKNRQGTLGDLPLKWRREQTRFECRSVSELPNYNHTFASYGG